MAEDSSEKKGGGGLSDILSGLTGLLDMVSKIQESGEEGISRSGEFKTQSGTGARYGVQIKTAGGGEPGVGQFEVKREPKREPRRPKKTPGRESVEVREPMVDVLSQQDQVTIVAEIPGVSKESVELDVNGKKLTLFASADNRKYRAKVDLPYEVSPSASNLSYVNGIFSAVFDRRDTRNE